MSTPLKHTSRHPTCTHSIINNISLPLFPKCNSLLHHRTLPRHTCLQNIPLHQQLPIHHAAYISIFLRVELDDHLGQVQYLRLLNRLFLLPLLFQTIGDTLGERQKLSSHYGPVIHLSRLPNLFSINPHHLSS